MRQRQPDRHGLGYGKIAARRREIVLDGDPMQVDRRFVHADLLKLSPS
jgi:hypothetical protein